MGADWTTADKHWHGQAKQVDPPVCISVHCSYMGLSVVSTGTTYYGFTVCADCRPRARGRPASLLYSRPRAAAAHFNSLAWYLLGLPLTNESEPPARPTAEPPAHPTALPSVRARVLWHACVVWCVCVCALIVLTTMLCDCADLRGLWPTWQPKVTRCYCKCMMGTGAGVCAVCVFLCLCFRHSLCFCFVWLKTWSFSFQCILSRKSLLW